MQKIKKKLDELEKLLKDHKPTGQEARAFRLINSYVSLAVNAASFKSRVKNDPNPQKQAAKLNEVFKDPANIPKPKPQKKRGRPKKETKENVLASTTAPKTLTEKLKND